MSLKVFKDFCEVLSEISLKILLSQIFYLSSYIKGLHCCVNLLYNLLNMSNLISLSYCSAFCYLLIDIKQDLDFH